MATLKQIAANRANSARSTGPKSSRGKAASSQNATSHGICASVLTVFHWESPAEFEELREQYMTRFRPIDRVERDLVDRLVDSTWRRNRVLSIETTLFDIEIEGMDSKIRESYDEIDNGLLRISLAFRERHGERTSDSIQRYLAGAERSYQRALRELETLQAERFNQMPPPLSIPDADEAADPRENVQQPQRPPGKIHVVTERSQSPTDPLETAPFNKEPANPNEAPTEPDTAV